MFEFVCFQLNCADAGWLLEVSFQSMFHIAVTLGVHIAIIWKAWCLHFGIPSTILAAWGHPGTPWEQQEGRVGVQNQIVIDLVMILGLHFESFLGSGLVSRSRCAPIVESKG